VGISLTAVAVVGVVGHAMYGCGARSRDGQVSDLASRLAQSEKTVEVKDGLYATQLVEVHNLNSLLDTGRAETKNLREQLDESKSTLLTTQQVAVRWKKAFEGTLTARQTDGGPSPTAPGITRKRVDFERDFGPISVSGHTLTDPAEGDVSVRQTRPLLLTVNVARGRDGKWASLVTSSEPTMEVGVTLGGVDVGAIPGPSWYQRLWVDLGASVLGDAGASLGISYRGDRFSVGPSCFLTGVSHGCGLSVGARIFK
jgi:hypothetical protein